MRINGLHLRPFALLCVLLLSSSASAREPGAAAGCAKDIDCEADLICVDGACTDPGGDRESPPTSEPEAGVDEEPSPPETVTEAAEEAPPSTPAPGGVGERPVPERGSSKPPVATIGVTGNLWFVPKEHYSGGGDSETYDGEISGGFTLFGEYYVIPYLTVGGQFDFVAFGAEDFGSPDERFPMVGAAAVLRGLFPFGQRKQFEPYLKFAVGYVALLAPTGYHGEWDNKHCWSIKVLPGFAYRFPFGLSVMMEIGWTGVGYTDGASTKVTALWHSGVLNIGTAYSF